MNEIWKDIINFPGYKISNFGRVKSPKCILKPSNHTEGYSYVCLYKNKKGYQFGIHRLVALHFIPNPLNKRTINHIDTNKKNNLITNLEWSTYKENMEHACLHKLVATKEKQGLAKLSYFDVLKIRHIYAEKRMSQRQLAKSFKVCQRTIAMIINRITWKD